MEIFRQVLLALTSFGVVGVPAGAIFGCFLYGTTFGFYGK